jgi:DnaJ-class molecular chaperone
VKPAGTHSLFIHRERIALTEHCKCCNYTGHVQETCPFCEGKGVVLTTNGVHVLEFVREFLSHESK